MTECVGDSMVCRGVVSGRFCELWPVVVACFVQVVFSEERWVVLVNEGVCVVDLGGAENSDCSMVLVIAGGTLLKDNVLPPAVLRRGGGKPSEEEAR